MLSWRAGGEPAADGVLEAAGALVAATPTLTPADGTVFALLALEITLTEGAICTAGAGSCAAGGVEVGFACAAAAASLAARTDGSGLLGGSGLVAGAGLLSETAGMLTREADATPGGFALGETANGSERTGGSEVLDTGAGVFGAAAGGEEDGTDAAAGDDGRGGAVGDAGEEDGAGVDGRRSVGADSDEGPEDGAGVDGRGGAGVDGPDFATAPGAVRGTNPDARRAPSPADGGPEGRGVAAAAAGGTDDAGRGATGTGEGATAGEEDSGFSEDGTISAGVVRGNEPKMSSSSPHPESTFCSSFLSKAAGAGLLTGRGATLGAAGDVSQAESSVSLSAVLIGGDSASFMSASDGENGRTKEAMVRRPGAV